MSDTRLEETKAFVRRVLARIQANSAVTDDVVEAVARKIVKSFRFLDK